MLQNHREEQEVGILSGNLMIYIHTSEVLVLGALLVLICCVVGSIYFCVPSFIFIIVYIDE